MKVGSFTNSSPNATVTLLNLASFRNVWIWRHYQVYQTGNFDLDHINHRDKLGQVDPTWGILGLAPVLE